ncbi:MAG: tripartite tricarboxylate transporter substrate binding protein [Burkholderiales bacterium]|nr:tripartite tricarboxylate transporter substrate binding protein [Pseudomonadota bacterium]MCC7067750.1 tripartite tricarboxylate transporter substrate binding protein [Burkholderiales bacterium]MCZ2134560.1 tripartite tricarboxylate transporter substrate binding protein [Burkholderiales bacterium]
MSIRHALATVAALAATAALAQAYPSKPIKFVVPFPAGSATDVVGRVLADAMGKELGQSIVVDNKAGAQGTIGAGEVKNAAADGYTLLVTTSTTQAAVTSLLRKVPYDPIKDFTPIGKIATTPFVLICNERVPATDLKSFIAYVKANPGKVRFGQGSSGSWVSGSLFASMIQGDMQMIPYKGIPQAITDMLGGSIEVVFADLGNAQAQIKGGKVKAFGVTSTRRSAALPDLPAITELVPGYELVPWFALMAPANLPRDVAARLGNALQKVLSQPEVRTKMQASGLDIDWTDANALARLIDSEIKRWAQLTKAAKIEAE